MKTIKEMIMEQVNYCNAIAVDILEHNKSKEIQEYAKRFAEIESPLVGGTDADWIRINWGDIYIFLHDNGEVEYQVDGLGEYGGELIVSHDFEQFVAKIQSTNEADFIENHYSLPDNGDYTEDCPSMYIPMK